MRLLSDRSDLEPALLLANAMRDAKGYRIRPPPALRQPAAASANANVGGKAADEEKAAKTHGGKDDVRGECLGAALHPCPA